VVTRSPIDRTCSILLLCGADKHFLEDVERKVKQTI